MAAPVPLTPWQKNLLNKVRTTGNGSVQDVLRELGPSSGFTLDTLQKFLTNAGETVPLTNAESMAQKAQAGIDSGTVVPLTEWSMEKYNDALKRGLSAKDLTTEFNMFNTNNPTLTGTNIKLTEVETILKGAGLKLPVRTPYGQTGATPGTDPQLKSSAAQTRRVLSQGFKGQTDTILTGGRGVATNALLKRKILGSSRGLN